jgi:cation transport ATPase-like protein
MMKEEDKFPKLDWHTFTKDQVLKALKTNDKRGLTTNEAKHRL